MNDVRRREVELLCVDRGGDVAVLVGKEAGEDGVDDGGRDEAEDPGDGEEVGETFSDGDGGVDGLNETWKSCDEVTGDQYWKTGRKRGRAG